MSRGLIARLRSPHPLDSHLPDVLLAEEPAERAVTALPLGTYTSEIDEADLDVGDGDAPVSLGHLQGLWVLKLSGDPAAEGRPLRVKLWREGRAVATGRLASSGRKATFNTNDCGVAEGVYEWSLVGDSLRLALVEDACSSRRLVLTANAWQRQSFVVRLMSAFDDALAPIFSSLDNLDAYLDPRLAPRDFVDWLSGWVALAPNHAWPLRHRRERIAGEAQLALVWGTVDGIKDVVSIFAGVARENVEIMESGGVTTSPTPGGELPGDPVPQLTVRVRVPDPSDFDLVRLRRVVAAAKPAHLPHEVEVLGA